jgi:hypothetical protein
LEYPASPSLSLYYGEAGASSIKPETSGIDAGSSNDGGFGFAKTDAPASMPCKDGVLAEA